MGLFACVHGRYGDCRTCDLIAAQERTAAAVDRQTATIERTATEAAAQAAERAREDRARQEAQQRAQAERDSEARREATRAQMQRDRAESEARAEARVDREMAAEAETERREVARLTTRYRGLGLSADEAESRARDEYLQQHLADLKVKHRIEADSRRTTHEMLMRGMEAQARREREEYEQEQARAADRKAAQLAANRRMMIESDEGTWQILVTTLGLVSALIAAWHEVFTVATVMAVIAALGWHLAVGQSRTERKVYSGTYSVAVLAFIVALPVFSWGDLNGRDPYYLAAAAVLTGLPLLINFRGRVLNYDRHVSGVDK